MSSINYNLVIVMPLPRGYIPRSEMSGLEERVVPVRDTPHYLLEEQGPSGLTASEDHCGNITVGGPGVSESGISYKTSNL